MNDKEVDLGKQTILAGIPIPITQIYAFHKIKKTMLGSLILIGVYSPIWLNEIPELEESGYTPNRLMFLVFCVVMVFFVRRLTRQYNASLPTEK